MVREVPADREVPEEDRSEKKVESGFEIDVGPSGNGWLHFLFDRLSEDDIIYSAGISDE